MVSGACAQVSALHRAFVELSDPYCGNVEFHIGELSTCYHGIAFEDARADRMRLLRPRFMEIVAHEADRVDLSVSALRLRSGDTRAT